MLSTSEYEGRKKMVARIIVGLTIVLAIVLTLVPNSEAGGIIPLVLVLLGLLYACLEVDVEDATDTTTYLVYAIAAGAAAQADVLNHIHSVGGHLDTILGHITTALYAGVVTVIVRRSFKRIRGL
jgi:hypothetical protein